MYRLIVFLLLFCGLSYVYLTTPIAIEKIYPEAEIASSTPSAALALSMFQNQAQQVPQIKRVYFQNRADLQYLATGNVIASLIPADEAILALAGYKIEIEQTHNDYIQQLPALQAASTDQGGIPGFACYRTVEETYTDMAQLPVAYPDLVQQVDIGDSWNKVNSDDADGHDIYALILTDQRYTIPGSDSKPALLLLAEVHAREYVTSEIAMRFAEHLLEQYGKDPDITWLLRYHEIHIIPMANPDGRQEAEAGVWWRKNTNAEGGCFDKFPHNSYYGTDLNRNSSFKWNQCQGFNCSTADPCKDTFRGLSAASEPETQAYQNYIASVFPDQRGPNDSDAAPLDTTGIFLTIHSYSELILVPWGWTERLAPNAIGLQTLGRKFGFYTQYETCYVSQPGCLYQADGTTDDWAYGELGVPSYTFELGTRFFQSCDYFENEIVQRNFDAFLYAFKAARRPYQTANGPEVINAALNITSTLRGGSVEISAEANDARYFSGGHGDEPSQAIAAARYTIETPSWVENSSSYSMEATDGGFDTELEMVSATLNTADLTPGDYLILIEAQDADGNWGVPTSLALEIMESQMVVTPQKAIFRPFIGTRGLYTLTVANYSPHTKHFLIQSSSQLYTAAQTVTAQRREQQSEEAIQQQPISEQAWQVTVPNRIGPVEPGESAEFIVAVDIPADANYLESQLTEIDVSSSIAFPGDVSEKQQAILTIYNESYKQFFPFMAK